MRKFLILVSAVTLLLTSCASVKNASKAAKAFSGAAINDYKKVEKGKVTFSNVDMEEKAVKYNQKCDDYENVTVVDCEKSFSRNLVTVSLSDFNEFDVQIDFSCDLKAVSADGSETDITWFINEPDAGLPQISREKIPSDKWTHFSGNAELTLGEKRQMYISAAGIKREGLKLYIRNFNLTVYSDQIGKEKTAQVNWMDAPSLAKTYEPYFDYIGLTTPLRGGLETTEVLEGLEYQVNCITMENEFKPDFVFAWAKPGNFKDFVAEDGKTYKMPGNTPVFNNINAILNYAKAYNLKIRGHVLVWHSQTPDWFFRENFGDKNQPFVSEEEMTAREEWYIKTVVEYVSNWEEKNNHGKRIVFAWDVVNESASDNATSSQWLRTDSNWYRVFKSDKFIVNAFRYANKYAPKDVLLVLNDYGCSSYNKCGAILKIVDAIQAASDARIDVVGMQSHIGMNTPLTGPNSYETSIQRFLEKGVNIQVTELDIGQDGQKYNSEKLKQKYHDLFTVLLRNRKTDGKNGVQGVTLWGILDENSWIYNGANGKQHPLLFEKDYICKPAFYGVLEAAEEVENQQTEGVQS